MKDTMAEQEDTSLAHITCPQTLLSYYAQLEDQLSEVRKTERTLEKMKFAAEQRLAKISLPEGQTRADFPQGTIKLVTRDVFNASDWEAFYKWVAEDPMNRTSGYLHKRLGSTELSKMHKEQGVLPPGIERLTLTDVKIQTTGE